jgi:hypothetical protein
MSQIEKYLKNKIKSNPKDSERIKKELEEIKKQIIDYKPKKKTKEAA